MNQEQVFKIARLALVFLAILTVLSTVIQTHFNIKYSNLGKELNVVDNQLNSLKDNQVIIEENNAILKSAQYIKYKARKDLGMYAKTGKAVYLYLSEDISLKK